MRGQIEFCQDLLSHVSWQVSVGKRETRGERGVCMAFSRPFRGLDLRGGQSYRRTSNEHLFVLSSRPTICTSVEAARQDRLLSAANLALLLLWRAHEPSRVPLEIPRENHTQPST